MNSFSNVSLSTAHLVQDSEVFCGPNLVSSICLTLCGCSTKAWSVIEVPSSNRLAINVGKYVTFRALRTHVVTMKTCTDHQSSDAEQVKKQGAYCNASQN